MLSSTTGVNHWTKWLKSTVSDDSIKRNKIDVDVLSYATIRNTYLKLQQQKLQQEDASEKEQLETANRRIEALEASAKERLEWEQVLSNEHKSAEERVKLAEGQRQSNAFRIQQLIGQLREQGETPDSNIQLPTAWSEFSDWCRTNLSGRVILAQKAHREIKNPDFNEPESAAKCLMWLANEGRDWKMKGGDGTFREYIIEPGYVNAHCGSDVHKTNWQGRPHEVAWHIKNGGNTRDPKRCLRIYYFWDDSSQQFVVSEMPAHRVTGAS